MTKSKGEGCESSSHRAVNSAPLAVLAVEKVAHGLPPGFIRFRRALAVVQVHSQLRFRSGLLGFAAGWAAVGKTGFTRLQLELLRAYGADSNRKCHHANYDKPDRPDLLLITRGSEILAPRSSFAFAHLSVSMRKS